MEQTASQRKTTKKKSRKITPARQRPPIEPTAIYSRRWAAEAVGVSEITLFRAYDSGNLKGYRVGSRVSHSGQHLIDWMESGGKTGRTMEDVRKERAAALKF